MVAATPCTSPCRGIRGDAQHRALNPSPDPPAWPAAQCRARMAAGDPSHRELCIWRHSWPSPWGTCGAASGLLPSLLPFSHGPSRGSDSQIRSWENTHHLGFIWGWALQVQAQFVPGQEESGPLRSPGTSGLCRSPPHIPAHTTSLPPSLRLLFLHQPVDVVLSPVLAG